MKQVKWWHSLPVRIWLSVLALVLLIAGAMQVAWVVGERERKANVERSGQFIDASGTSYTGTLVPETRREPGKPAVYSFTFVAPNGSKQVMQWEGRRLTPLQQLFRPRNSIFIQFGMSLAVCAIAGLIAWSATRRLMRLQRDIQRWSEGNLALRADANGKDEVAALARNFNSAAAQIQTLVQEKDALLRAQKMMLANSSHEMRAALNRILGAEALLPGGPENEQWHEDIRKGVQELDELTEDILDSSKMEAELNLMDKATEVDLLGTVINECLQEDVVLKDARGRYWLNPSPESTFGETAFSDGSDDLPEPKNYSVRGVERLLRRAVGNLLRNARRYGGAEGVCVTFDTEGGNAVLHVDDSGPGVPEDEREDIFKPFYRTKSASEKQGGWGLGLAMVRTIAQRHGGSAECSSAPGGGARFTLRLPLYSEAAAA